MSDEYCCRLLEKHSFVGVSYPECPNKAKYHVEYKGMIRGKLKKEKLCGVHFRALEKILTNRNREFIKVENL